MTTVPVDTVVVGWYMTELVPARYLAMKNGWDAWRRDRPHFLRDRQFVTAAAFVPCPIDWTTGTYTERPRIPAVEIDGVVQENALDAFHRIARWPISCEEWKRRRGYGR